MNTSSNLYSLALGVGSSATADQATAVGVNSKASAALATAIGHGAEAAGIGSVALGKDVYTAGDYSLAMGNNTITLGKYASSFGFNTTAKSRAEIVLGEYNTDYTPIGTTTFESTDRLFVLGNGTSSIASDAVVVYKNGNTEINGSISVSGTHGSGETIGASSAIPSGAGSRMFYYPKKSAFRAGLVTGTQWDDANVGNYSVAMGYNVTASGSYSFAAAGGEASGIQAICLGSGTASGPLSASLGSGNTVTGQGAITVGTNLSAPSASEVVVGHYNTSYTPTAPALFSPSDRVFTVGNGGVFSSTSNALTIWKNGRMQLGGDETSSNAQRGKFTILGTAGNATVGSYNFINNSSNSVHTGSAPTGALSLYADGAIAGTQVWAHSDARIKENITSTDSKDDLAL